MSSAAIAFFAKIRSLCKHHAAHALWDLGVTHPSVRGAPTAQLALSALGRKGLELILAWRHICSHKNTTSGTLSLHVNTLMSSRSLVDALFCDETFPMFKLGREYSYRNISQDTKKQFIFAALGTCFYLDTAKAAHLVLDDLLPWLSCPSASTKADPKSRLQQYARSIKAPPPRYTVLSEDGLNHEKQFTVRTQVPGTDHSAEGRGANKRAAETDAAAALLRQFGSQLVNPPSGRGAHSSDSNQHGHFALDSSEAASPNLNQTYIDNGTARFIQFFKDRTGIELPPRLAAIAINHTDVDSDSACASGLDPKALATLGNFVYLYALPAALFRELDLSQLSAPDLRSRLAAALTAIASRPYKSRLAQPWSVFVRTRRAVPRPLPEGILLDAFERILGASVLLDFRNIDPIANYLREQLNTDVDFGTTTVDPLVLSEVTNLAWSQLQRLWHMFFRRNQPNREAVLAFDAVGPCHAVRFSCRLLGDSSGQFTGVAGTKVVARKLACGKALAFACYQCSAIRAIPSSVEWLDSLVLAMRRDLVDDPTEAIWLTVPFETLPFSRQEFWSAVSAAVRDPGQKCLAGLQAIEGNRDLSVLQKQKLGRFLANRRAEGTAAGLIRTVEMSLRGLLQKPAIRTGAHAVGVVCSGLHLLKCLERRKRRRVTAPEVVAQALSVLGTGGCLRILVPTRLGCVEPEAYFAVLQQLRGSQCVCGSIAVTWTADKLEISGHVSGSAVVDHEPLFNATWELINASMRGFTVTCSADSFCLAIPLVSEVYVTADGVADDDVNTAIEQLWPMIDLSQDVQGVCSALHEMKNRIIASPERWTEEITGCAASLTKAAEVMRAPQLERVTAERICGVMVEAVGSSNATYGTAGDIEVMREDDSCYVDLAMLATIVGNLTDNAARAASEVRGGVWRLEGIITGSDIDVSVSNSCRDIAAAKASITSGSTRSTAVFGSGIGLGTIKRLAAKLVGSVRYDFEGKRVCANLVVPVDLARASWTLD